MNKWIIATLVLVVGLGALISPSPVHAQNVVIDDYTAGTVQLGRTTAGWTPVAPGTSGSVTASITDYLVGASDQSQVSYEYLFTDFAGIDFTDVDSIVLEFVQDDSNPAIDFAVIGLVATTTEVPTESTSMGSLKSNYR